MARRRHRRRRRGFGDYVSIPLGFGKMKLPNLKSLNPLGKHVSSTDVLIGAFIGLAGGVGLRYVLNRFWPTAPAFLQTYAVPITTVGAGAVVMAVLKNKSKGQGYFAGAALAGLVPLGWNMLQANIPQLADYVNVDYGYPVDVGMHSQARLGGYGIIVDEKSPRLSALAGFSNEAEDDNPYATFAP